ncbi:MAG: hypothetical protein ABNH53_11790 [Henriciella sp.]
MLFVTACATAYQPQGFSGGFSEIPIAEDAYKINVQGNGFTNAGRVNEMALLRGAELANENGYSYFVVLDNATYKQTSQYTTPSTSTTNTYGSSQAYIYGNTVNAYGSSTSKTTYNPGQTYNIVKPGVDVIIQFVPAEYAREARALSVTQIYSMYAEKYGLEFSQTEP